MQKKEERRELDYTAVGSAAGLIVILFFGLGLFDLVNAFYFFWIAIGGGSILNGSLAGIAFARRHKAAGIFFLFLAAVCLGIFLYQVIYILEGKS